MLGRYFGAARSVDATEVMRVTSDCPLIDPEVCDAVIGLRRSTGAPYACNNMPATWPHGLDCEVFTMAALEDAADKAADPFDREHVTPFIRRSGEVSNLPSPDPSLRHHRWTLDTADDLAFFQALLPRVQEKGLTGWQQVVDFIGLNPEIGAINAHLSRA